MMTLVIFVVFVMYSPVIEERTIHRDQSAGLGINADRERLEQFLAGWENKMPSGNYPADIESNDNDSWGLSAVNKLMAI